MATKTPFPMLEDEERRTRIRLAAFRAKLYRHDRASPMATEIRLHELERKWKGAAERLRSGRKNAP
jgi:hypothetical protein